MFLSLSQVVPVTAAQEVADQAARLEDVLSPYVMVFFIAWLVTIITTPIMRLLALHNGVIDRPDLKRKIHLEPVAYLGGVAIFFGWFCAVFACYFIAPKFATAYTGAVDFPIPIIIGAAVITVTGLIDDVYGISPRAKLGGQLFAAAAISLTDVGTRFMTDLFLVVGLQGPQYDVWAYSLGAVMIALFILGGCNAVNLLDGLDGLAAGVCAISAMGFLIIATMVAMQTPATEEVMRAKDIMADPVRLVMCLAMLGALLGFLPYNFNRANIFMGDTGSLLLGYLSVTAIMLFALAAERGPMLVMAALIVFALPITDTALAIFRRTMRRQGIFSPDNHHLHHQALRFYQNMGLGPAGAVKAAVLTMYALAGLFAALGVLMVGLELRWRYVMAVFMPLFGFVVVMAYKSSHQTLLLEELQAKQDASENEARPPAAAAEPPSVTPPATPAPGTKSATGH